MNYKEVAAMETEVVGDVADVFKNVGQAVGETFANKVKIETTVFSDNVVPFDKNAKGTGIRDEASRIGKILKPKMTVYNSMGQVEYQTAPYGEPKDTAGIVKAGIIASLLLGAGVAFGAGRISKR